jgi:hypothetical protein
MEVGGLVLMGVWWWGDGSWLASCAPGARPAPPRAIGGERVSVWGYVWVGEALVPGQVLVGGGTRC